MRQGQPDENAERVFRIFGGLGVGIAIAWTAQFVHEGAHWLLTVPQGGSLIGWHWNPPGWFHVIPGSEPWGTMSFYLGGLAAGLYLIICLGAIIWRLRLSRSLFWWAVCLPLAFGASAELFTGIAEGAFNEFYNHSVFFFLWVVLIGFLGMALYWRMIRRPKPT